MLQRDRLTKRYCACLSGLAVATALLVVLPPNTAAGEDPLPEPGPRLQEITREHERLRNQLRSGRLTYTVTKTCAEEKMELYRARWRGVGETYAKGIEAAGIPRDQQGMTESIARSLTSHAESYARVDFLRDNGSYSASIVFDRNAGASIWTQRDLRDLAALAVEYDLDEAAMAQFPERESCVCTDEMLFGYSSASPYASLHFSPGTNLVPELFRTMAAPIGLLSPRWVGSGDWELSQTETGTVTMLGTVGERQEVMVLDPAIGHRLRKWSSWRDGVLLRERTWEYARWGETLFPSRYEQTAFEPSGAELEKVVYEFTEAELNVPIEAEEFEFELPPGVGVLDTRTGATLRPAGNSGSATEGTMSLKELSVMLLEEAAAPQADADGLFQMQP